MVRNGENFHLDSKHLTSKGRLRDSDEAFRAFYRQAELRVLSTDSSVSLQRISNWIEDGPLIFFVQETNGFLHSYVVAGVNGAILTIHDPWPSSTSPEHIEYSDFASDKLHPTIAVLQTTRQFVTREI